MAVPADATRQKLLSALLIVVGLAGLGRVIWHDSPDALKYSNDLRGTFLSDRAWVRGVNPYDDDVQRQQWQQAREPSDEKGLDPDFYFRRTPSLYPPTTLALTFPIAFASWKTVRIAWLIQNWVLTILAYLALCNMMGLSLTNWRAQLLAVLWLMLGPFNTCIRLGTLTWPAVMLDVLTIWAVIRHRYVLAGLMLGVAVILKPQLSSALVVFYFLRPARKTAWIAIGVFVVESIVGVGKLWIDHIDWIPGLRASLKGIQGPGGFNDASRLNPYAWQVVNFQYPLFGVLHNRTIVNAIAWLVALTLAVIFLIAWRRAQGVLLTRQRTTPPAFEALAACIPLLICLLPVYHRYYDCIILVMALAWGVAFLGTRLNRLAWCAVLCTAPFYASWPYILDSLANKGHTPPHVASTWWWQTLGMPVQIRVAQVASTWWWQTLVMPIQIWVLIGLILVLITALGRMATEPAQPQVA